MAMRNPRFTVFLGAVGALAAMTALSAAMGWAAPNLVSNPAVVVPMQHAVMHGIGV